MAPDPRLPTSQPKPRHPGSTEAIGPSQGGNETVLDRPAGEQADKERDNHARPISDRRRHD
ncbi:MAG TPA: hypothetical protein VH519_01580 [Hyphomicrobiaceae bacterium]|jgi:hypothetical protein